MSALMEFYEFILNGVFLVVLVAGAASVVYFLILLVIEIKKFHVKGMQRVNALKSKH